MPRPLVEVRQAVLNPVVTINDPQQEVCIIGLHTEAYTDQIVNELDIPYTVEAGASLHQAASTLAEFTIDVNGVFLDEAVDFGPDEFDLDGTQVLSFSEAWVSYADLSTGSNIADDMGGFSSEITLGTVSNLNGVTGILVAQPAADHKNKLVYASGELVDFNNSAFEGLTPGNEIKFTPAGQQAASSFVIIRKDQDGIYLRGSDPATHAFLNSENTHFSITDDADAAIAEDTRFSLVHPGVHEVTVTAIEGTKVSCSSPLPFAVRVSDNPDLKAALLTQVPTADLTSVTESSSLTVTQTGGTGDVEVTVSAEHLQYAAKAIVRATMTMSYVVARTEYSAALTPVDQNTYSSVLGAPGPQNPLSLAAELALLNSGSSSVNVLSLDLTPYEGSDEVKSVEQAFVDALAIINRHPTTYAMVPLTNSMTVTKAYANAAEAMSVPRKGKFRICLGSSKGAPSEDFIIGSENSPAKFGTVANGILTNSAGDMYRLPASKVLTGDSVTAVGNNQVYLGTVSDATNTEVTVTWDGQVPAGELSSYYISRSLLPRTSIPRQLEILKAEANSVASKRLFLTFPGACTVTSGDNQYVGLPSYYVTSAFAGLLARLEIHRPKNFLGLAGVSGLQDFSRFDDDQLDAISDAGYLVFQQEEATSAPFCIHQVNSYHGVAAGTQEYTELSVLANFDFVSRYLKEVLDPFAGTVNIVPSTFGIINASLDAAMDNLRSRRVATIGAPLISGTVEFVRQASYDSGTLEANVLVSLPKVLNKIILEVVSG
jgi:hypothetical protein